MSRSYKKNIPYRKNKQDVEEREITGKSGKEGRVKRSKVNQRLRNIKHADLDEWDDDFESFEKI